MTDIQTTAKAYKSEIVSGWERLYKKKRMRLYEVLSRFYRGESALELGVADGESTRHIADKFKHLEVVDASIDFIAAIKQQFPGVVAHHKYFEEFAPAGKFSTIFMTHILEHLDDPVELLNRAHEWLTDDGVVLISVPNAQSLHRLVGVKMGMLETPYSLNAQDVKLGHKRVFDKTTMLEVIDQTPFRVVHFTGLMLKPISNRQIERDWDARLIEAFFELGFDFPELCAEIVFVLDKRS